MTTLAPSAARCRACDLPMPLAPPVISATLPSSRPTATSGPLQSATLTVACPAAARAVTPYGTRIEPVLLYPQQRRSFLRKPEGVGAVRPPDEGDVIGEAIVVIGEVIAGD